MYKRPQHNSMEIIYYTTYPHISHRDVTDLAQS